MNRANNRTRWPNKILAVAGIICTLALLFFFAPTEYRFYPRCLFHSLTGLNCPFCGCLRATHQLLHGNFQNALSLNPLFVLALVPVSIFVLASKMFNQRISSVVSASTAVWIWIGIFIVFGIARNFSAFSRMFP